MGSEDNKPGIHIISNQIGQDYCQNTGINIHLRLSNFTKAIFRTYYRSNTNSPWQDVGCIVNTANLDFGGSTFLASGNNYLNIKVNTTSVIMAPTEQVKIKLHYCHKMKLTSTARTES